MLTYGKPTDWVEDEYAMNKNVSSGGATSISAGQGFGDDTAQYPQEVIITCANKKGRVRASLSGNLSLNIQSEWTEMFSGGIASMSGSIIGTANQLVQWGLGATIQQPWMNRKNYKNTKPFSFNLPLNFVAIDSAKFDVVMPVLALVSFCYPRKYTPAENGNEESAKDVAPNEPGINVAKVYGTDNIIGKWASKQGPDSLFGSVLDLFEVWEIPGPSLLTASDKKDAHKGDSVDIIVGKMFNLGNCYLESVGITFGSAFDNNGYPLSAKVDVKCTCADSVVCTSDGNLLVNEYYDMSKQLDKVLTAAGNTVENLVNRLVDFGQAARGFYSGSLQVQEVK
jgi:hypothetical protein